MLLIITKQFALSRLILVIGLVSFLCGYGFTQSDLPKPSVLAEKGIKTITVSRTALRYEYLNEKSQKNDSLDKATQQLTKYFINDVGLIDSIYHYPNDSGYYKKDVLKYDSTSRLFEIIYFTPDNKVQKREMLEKTPENDWHYRLWEFGALKLETKATADSIVFESIRYHGQAADSSYTIMTYDLENEIRINASYYGEELLYQERCQWITENGIPKRFLYSLFERNEGKKKPKTENYELEMDETGMVINKLNGSVFDPFRLRGYYDRHEDFRGLGHYQGAYFKEDIFIYENESSELFSFDGTEIVYLYQIDYQ